MNSHADDSPPKGVIIVPGVTSAEFILSVMAKLMRHRDMDKNRPVMWLTSKSGELICQDYLE